jgi:hypothetical protein
MVRNRLSGGHPMTSSNLLQTFAIGATTFLGVGLAHAGFIQTPMILDSDPAAVSCVATTTNPNAPVTVTIRILDGGGDVLDSATCTLGPSQVGCVTEATSSAAYCRISVSNMTSEQVLQRIRASLLVRESPGLKLRMGFEAR